MHEQQKEIVGLDSNELKEIKKQNLKKLLSDKKITQREFAKKLGYSPEHINALIQGREEVSEKFAKKVVQVFPEIRVGWLLGIDKYETLHSLIEGKIIECSDCISAFNVILDYSAEHIGYRLESVDVDVGDTERNEEDTAQKVEEYDEKVRKVVHSILKTNDGTSVEMTEGDYDDLIADVIGYTGYLLKRLADTKRKTWYPFRISHKEVENG